jgi:hypothetical protein
MLPRPRLAGPPLALDDPRFGLAVEVAAIDVELEDHPAPPREALDREHVERLRRSGATRFEVAEYAATLLNPRLVDRLLDDLDSYGSWRGD